MAKEDQIRAVSSGCPWLEIPFTPFNFPSSLAARPRQLLGRAAHPPNPPEIRAGRDGSQHGFKRPRSSVLGRAYFAWLVRGTPADFICRAPRSSCTSRDCLKFGSSFFCFTATSFRSAPTLRVGLAGFVFTWEIYSTNPQVGSPLLGQNEAVLADPPTPRGVTSWAIPRPPL